MTIREQMISALGRSKKTLGESVKLVIKFFQSCSNHDGGFHGRGKKSDLYYTAFGLEALLALGETISQNTAKFLRQFQQNLPDDLVHLSSLIRCYANIHKNDIDQKFKNILAEELENYRSDDGGFAQEKKPRNGTIYGCFLTLFAYQDLRLQIPDAAKVINFIKSLQKSNGGYANSESIKVSATPATAAAMMILNHLDEPIAEETKSWLANQCTDKGGFRAIPLAPVADLLSTATALHALAVTGADIEKDRKSVV